MNQQTLTRRRALATGCTLVLSSALSGCLSGSRPTEQRTVSMTDDLRFEPASIRIPANTEVVWENPTAAKHTVTAIEASVPDPAEYFASGGFDSEAHARNNSNDGLIETGGTYSHSFELPGTYEYVCLPHEQSDMTGTVTVTTSSMSN